MNAVISSDKMNFGITRTKMPVLAGEDSLQAYLNAIKNFPILKPEEENELARRWREDGDSEAAHRLVTSHLRLVAKVSFGYRGYGLPMADIISEGNLGLMQAVKKYDEKKGFRLATYAVWWIKASIHEYILHSWSLVKIGTTAAQKKLFFNLRKMKAKIQGAEDRHLSDAEIQSIATELNVSSREVATMDVRISSHDSSLNAPIGGFGDEDSSQYEDYLVDEKNQPETNIEAMEQDKFYRELMNKALGTLNEREQEIIKARYLIEEPKTLEDIARHYQVSRERIRQIEVRAIEKIREATKNAYQFQ